VKPRVYKLIAALCGVATALSFYGKYLSWLCWVSIVPLVLVLLQADREGKCTLRRGYSVSFCFFLTFHITAYSFILYMYPMEYAGITPFMSAFILLLGLILMSLLFSSIFSFIGVIFLVLKHKTLFGRYKILLAFLFPALWIIFEWAQTLTWFGVPFVWLAVSQQYALPVIQSASLFGALFVDFIILSVNSLLAFSFFYGEIYEKKRVFAILAAGIFVLNLAFGMVKTISYSSGEPEETTRVSVIQGNISSIDERDDMRYGDIRELYINLCESAAEDGAELIVIPESALPAYFNLNKDKLSTFRKFAMEYDVTIILGGYYKQYHSDGSEAPSNAMYCINPDGSVGDTPYIKRKLVPFGEYIPIRPIIETLLPVLTSISMLADDAGKGEDSALHDTVYGKVSSLICYDSIYPSMARDAVNDGAELLTVSTDDSWFEDSPEIYIHLGHSVLRAIENGRYLARAANTGVSAVISPIGEILADIDANAQGCVSFDVEFLDGATLYSVVGDIIVYAAMIYVAGVVTISLIIKPLKKQAL